MSKKGKLAVEYIIAFVLALLLLALLIYYSSDLKDKMLGMIKTFVETLFGLGD